MAITKQQREKVEALVYEVMDATDISKTNTEYYKTLFASMDDAAFEKMFQRQLCIKFQHRPWVTNPTPADIKRGLAIMKIPYTEKIYMPDVARNENGEPVTSLDAITLFINIKCMQQMGVKKNSYSTDIAKRDMKTGLLLGYDKNGKTSDREQESLVVMGLDKTVDEFARVRADAMEAKAEFYNTINTLGTVSAKDYTIAEDDSIAKNIINVYFLGAGINSNLLNTDYYLPYTIKERNNKITRI